jgi:SAM-dependent methyltransferase
MTTDVPDGPVQSLRGIAATFFSINREMSERLQHRFRFADDKWIWGLFEARVHGLISQLRPDGVFVDLGGGRRCVYRGALVQRRDVLAVGVDISTHELAANGDLSAKVAADATAGLGIAPGRVDLLVSRALLEHVADVRAAARAINAVIRPGGVTVHLLPCRYSLFALLARLLPKRFAFAVQHLATPSSIGHVEFDVHYDSGTPSGLERAFRECGFRHVRVTPCWSQSDYFRPVLPLYLLVVAYDAVLRHLRVRPLATYAVVEAMA